MIIDKQLIFTKIDESTGSDPYNQTSDKIFQMIGDELDEQLIDDLLKGKPADSEVVHVDFAMHMVGCSNSPTDRAGDYLNALILGELIAPLCSSIKCEEMRIPKGSCYTYIRFICIPKDRKALGEKLAWFLEEDWEQPRVDFQEDLNNNVKHFDNIAKAFVLNAEAGLYELFHDEADYEEAYAWFREHHKRWLDTDEGG
ncbi:MAG: hypothetical protein MK172_08480 [Verrucomicrobiales bacterium]|nr:hypothetical protein [Verrucomicrobiales bacterium]